MKGNLPGDQLPVATFNPRRFTVAFITLLLGSVVTVENPKNGRWVRMRINECGPFALGRSLDLSFRAAQTLGITHHRVARMKITTVKPPPDADVDRCSR
jgi:rare lipoprotein A